MVVGPHTMTRYLFCSSSTSPGRRSTSAVKPFGGEKQNGKIGGTGNVDVQLGDGRGFALDRAFEGFGGFLQGRGIGLIGRVVNAKVILLWKFGVDGKPDDAAVVVTRRDLHGKFHHLAVVFNGYVAFKLVAGQGLLENIAQLNLRPGATCLDIGEHPLEIRNAAGQLLHFAQRVVYLLELIPHRFKARIQPLREGTRELFIHGGAHFVQLLFVALLQSLLTVSVRV